MSHYQFKKWFFILVGLLSLAAMSELQAQKKQPNILVIMADDIGLTNLGCYGGDIMGVPTPNIDRIASQGLKLTSFYGQPSCTAGRAAFITGQLPIRTGMTTVGVPGSEVGLQPEDPTLADVLKSKGYATAQFGKNHLGDLEKFLPHRHGFDVFYGNLYHLNANEDPEDLDRPSDPAYK
jgi:arylsulfatase A-like enzyme